MTEKMDNFTSPKAGVPTGSGAVGFFEFAAWIGLAAIISALVLPLILGGYRWYKALFDYFTFVGGALAWRSMSATPALKVGTPAQDESPGDEAQGQKP